MTGRAALVAFLVALLCGCGVSTQARPEPLELSPTPSASPTDGGRDGSVGLRVYFVRGTRLEPVSRSSDAGDVGTTLAVLVAGPDRGEVLSGLRTAIAPETETAPTALPDGTVQVDLPRELTGLTGGNQLLAVAQLVWTLTESPAVRAVRFTSAGSPIEVPTDDGLTGEPVDRDDYDSVAPLSTARPTGTD